ncbi:hypothetical protein COT07_01420 [Candidatus Woesearchaeota archaeon CG07_land_8_20_14_0_80_44_23]|nr:MAG: hypothetical protein COT07_01420 [Candidatus Woesearchaeota archaeon CG07_land_8_20_14_0_80_44_23]
MDYWNDAITEKSWKRLQSIKEKFKFTLIGGWAVYLWTRNMKSKDIDVIVNFEGLNYLKLHYDLRKNDNLKKYEIKTEDADIDVYVPHYSKLAIPVEEIGKHSSIIEGFRVANAEILLILKQNAELERRESEKGEKDRIDIMNLVLNGDVDFEKYSEAIEQYNLNALKSNLIKIIREFKDYKYLNLNPRELKIKKELILKKLERL